MDFCKRFINRALDEQEGDILKLFLNKISDLFIFNIDFRLGIVQVMLNCFRRSSYNFSRLTEDSVVGSVYALYEFLLTNPIIGIQQLDNLADTHIIEYISEHFAENLIPSQKAILSIDNLNIPVRNTLEKLISTAEFLLTNGLLRRTELSTRSMKLLYACSNSNILRLRGKELACSYDGLSLQEYSHKIEVFSDLIDSMAEEPKFQSFFEENPFFLNPTVLHYIPKKSLAGELIPDFVLQLNNKSIIFVEIEKPSVKLYNAECCPTHNFIQAEQQIRDYMQWAIKDNAFLREHGIETITPDNTVGLLVVGSKITAKERQKLEERNKTTRATFITKTFLDVLFENKAIFANLQKMEKA